MGLTRDQSAVGAFVFRPRTGIVVCILWAILGLIWLVLCVRSGWRDVMSQAPFVALISTVVYAVCGRPLVIVGPQQVLLRNVIRDVTIPYPAITALDTQYALTITTFDGRRHQAWAAPAGGRLGAARMTEEERKSLTWSGPVQDIPSSAALRSDAGAAAAAIRRRWDPQRNPELALPRDSTHVQVRWATGILVAFVVSTMATLVVALT